MRDMTAQGHTDPIRLAIAILLIATAIFLLLAQLSYHPHQVGAAVSHASNLCGAAGAWLAHATIHTWGVGALVLPAALFGFGLPLLRHPRIHHLGARITATVLLLPIIAGLVHLLPVVGPLESLVLYWDHDHLGGLGGTMGSLLCGPVGVADPTLNSALTPIHPGGILRRNLAAGGSALVLVLALIGCFALLRLRLLESLKKQTERMRQVARPADPRQDPKRAGRPNPLAGAGPTPQLAANVPAAPAPPAVEQERDHGHGSSGQRPASSIQEISRAIAERDSTGGIDAVDLVERIRQRRRELEAAERGTSSGESRSSAVQAQPTASAHAQTSPASLESSSGGEVGKDSSSASRVAAASMSSTALDRQSGSVTPAATSSSLGDASPSTTEPELAVRAGSPKRATKPPVQRQEMVGDYALPEIEVLDECPEHDPEQHAAESHEVAKLIEDTFADFKINVKVVAATRGPVITQFEMELQDQGMRVNKVTGFENDLQLRLGTEGIRIVAPLPNKKTIGIEVPNQLKMAVVMRDLVEDIDPAKFSLPIVIGRDVIGGAMVGDLAKMPHLLVAGATGMGKSVCLNAIITSILLFRSPEEVKFIMVDPKMVELAPYEGIPHLLTPPITDMSKAHAALEWACKTMDERFYCLRIVGVRDIGAYNKLGADEIERRLNKKGKTLEDLPGIETHMPYITIVVDEYADLMMVNKDVEKSLVRLTAKARACGIHVILTTQRPSADVVTGLIKSNLPSRICFRVADKNNSRVVLDAGGAENLLGRGDMLYLPPGSSSLVRGQGVWVKDHEIEAIIEHAQSQGDPVYDESIFKAGAVAMAGGGGSGDDKASAWQRDHQFHEAVWSMYRYNKTGADFLRRKLRIGYNKATEYVETLEDLGFLGPQQGTRSREILRGWEDWLDLLKDHEIEYDTDDEIYRNPLQ